MSRSQLIVCCASALVLCIAGCAAPDYREPWHGQVVSVYDQAGRVLGDAVVRGHGPDGIEVVPVASNGTGKYFIEVPAGGSITVRDAARTEWRTVLAVGLDDSFAIELPVGEPADVNAWIVAPPLPSGAVAFYVRTTCGGGGPGEDVVEVTVDESCPPWGRGLYTLVLTAIDNNNEPVAYLVAPDIELHPYYVEVDGSWTAPRDFALVELLPLGPGIGWTHVHRAALNPFYVGDLTDVTLSGEAAVSRIIPHSGIGSRARYGASTTDGRFYSRVTDELEHFAVDEGDLMPPLAELTVSPGRLAWGGGAESDIAFGWIGVDDIETGTSRRWKIAGPPGGQLTFPADPDFVWPEAIERIRAGAGEVDWVGREGYLAIGIFDYTDWPAGGREGSVMRISTATTPGLRPVNP